MVTKRIDIRQMESLEDLLKILKGDTEIILTEGDKAIARVTSVETPADPRIPDLFPGIWMSEDFNEPLPDEFWTGEA